MARFAWLIIIGVAGLLAACNVTVGGSPGPTAGTESPVATTVAAPETPTETPPAPTQPPTTPAPTQLPTPPPKPANPTEPTSDLTGGQWYRYGCVDVYMPEGWTFSIQGGIADPGGGFIGFSVKSSESAIFFYQDSVVEWSRTVNDPALDPVFDQIAATMQKVC